MLGNFQTTQNTKETLSRLFRLELNYVIVLCGCVSKNDNEMMI
jgi:hypothetical protein